MIKVSVIKAEAPVNEKEYLSLLTIKIEVSLYSYHYLNCINSNLTNYFPDNEQTRLNFLKLSKPMVVGCWLLVDGCWLLLLVVVAG
jgi:hypothetical protein